MKRQDGENAQIRASRNEEKPFETAYTETAAEMRRRFRHASIDGVSLAQPLRTCDLSVCGGTCCHDGAYLSREEAEIIDATVQAESVWLEAHGYLSGADPIFREPDTGEYRLGLRSRNNRTIAGFPAHFADTGCVFLASDNRCLLQMLSVERGRHSWFWKPIACWMHPLQICGDGILRVPDAVSDTTVSADYPGFTAYTPCGAAQSNGVPATRALRPELEALTQILGEDFSRSLSEATEPTC